MLGLINGAFYALLSLGMSIIFGMLNVINFAHGAFYMLGAVGGLLLLTTFGLPYWAAIVLSPLAVVPLGIIVEKTILTRLYKLDHIYGWLATYGLALMIEAVVRRYFGVSGHPYPTPEGLTGGIDLGVMYLPIYRAWVVGFSLALCLALWFCIERTSLGSRLRAAVENPQVVTSFGINVPRMLTATYALSIGLAALAGVLAAPMYQVSSLMGSHIVIVVFAVVVIGGLGSIAGTIFTGFALGVLEGLTKAYYPQAAQLVIFIVMAVVLLAKPNGLFGRR